MENAIKVVESCRLRYVCFESSDIQSQSLKKLFESTMQVVKIYDKCRRFADKIEIIEFSNCLRKIYEKKINLNLGNGVYLDKFLAIAWNANLFAKQGTNDKASNKFANCVKR